MTYPHQGTDWQPYLDEVTLCYRAIINAVSRYERIVIVCSASQEDTHVLNGVSRSPITFANVCANDTWTRDHGPVSVFENKTRCVYDYTFNGWGLKFPSELDNRITRKLFDGGVFAPDVQYRDMLGYVLEGGSIESDGQGTVLTTSQCLLAPNRNDYCKSKRDIEFNVLSHLGVTRVLWLDHGYLEGDDTDGHIDTLARFCDAGTIAYVQCNDRSDSHFASLELMEQQLRTFRTANGAPYNLIPLPMAEPVYFDGQRLPATYANFLIINHAVLYPTYGSNLDTVAGERLQKAFPDRHIIGIDCRVLIRQHGSLHCITMQLPDGFL
jgi:agmatine/peptidylarginine deiminase